MLDKEFYYYRANQDRLLKDYNGRVIVISGDKVLGDYDTYLEAYVKTKKDHEPGTFLIQECTPGNKAYTVTCRNRVLV